MDVDERKLDGNVAGGILGTLFPFEMTSARTICAGCGHQRAVGELAVYLHPLGTIVRCPGCDTVQIRVAEIRGHYWLDLRGVRTMRIASRS